MPASDLTVERAVHLPKVLLHDHLDGGLRPTTIIELASEIGWNLPSADADELQTWFTAGASTRDIGRYLATFEHTAAVMQDAHALERIAAESVADLAADGVVYAEVRLAPELHQQRGLGLDEVVEAVTAGFRRAEAESPTPIVVNVILCAMRTTDRSLEVARLVDRLRSWDDKVVAFDLAGAETGFPPSLHAEALELARSTQQNVTIHASEPPGLELIAGAIEQGAHRIGHGVRLWDDIEVGTNGSLALGPLARHVLDHQIHLEMAPTCHVQIGAVESIAVHPLVPMLRAGFDVGINTDNRLMSGVTASSELRTVANAHAVTSVEMERLATNAMMSAFCPIEQRRSIVHDLIEPAYT